MPEMEQRPIERDSTLQRYYRSLESRIGYRLLLGGTRHYGYYQYATSSPLPVSTALRRMEMQLYEGLQCPPGSRVLDAGCGAGHVAINMSQAGEYQIECIDVVEHHVVKAKRNVRRAGMERSIFVRHADYHHLELFSTGSFDGIYTMETLVHSADPASVVREFFRILKPGGRIAMHEYDHHNLDKAPKDLVRAMSKVNSLTAMPANASFEIDALKYLLEDAGFEDVRLTDISEHIVPMLWLFYIVAIIPYTLFKLLRVDHRFPNTLAGVEGYRGRHLWRYVQVTARRPS